MLRIGLANRKIHLDNKITGENYGLIMHVNCMDFLKPLALQFDFLREPGSNKFAPIALTNEHLTAIRDFIIIRAREQMQEGDDAKSFLQLIGIIEPELPAAKRHLQRLVIPTTLTPGVR